MLDLTGFDDEGGHRPGGFGSWRLGIGYGGRPAAKTGPQMMEKGGGENAWPAQRAVVRPGRKGEFHAPAPESRDGPCANMAEKKRDEVGESHQPRCMVVSGRRRTLARPAKPAITLATIAGGIRRGETGGTSEISGLVSWQGPSRSRHCEVTLCYCLGGRALLGRDWHSTGAGTQRQMYCSAAGLSSNVTRQLLWEGQDRWELR